MRDTDLYARILGVERPWQVTDVELRLEAGEVEVKVEYARSGSTSCPECGMEAALYDSRFRRWRHLPTCQYKTILAAEVPRVRCPQHGVKTLAVPWAEPGSGFTALLEALVIDRLREASLQAVARRLDLTWDEVDGVMQRAVRRGLARRRLEVPRRLGVDETSFQKRHEYVTVVADVGRARRIFDAWYAWAIRSRLAPIKHVARMIKRHLEGVLYAIVAAVTNARLAGINTMIQGLKRSARGFRNLNRFRNAIYFHLGGLDLYPSAVTHSHS